MRGSRVKQLQQEFRRVNGRGPRKATTWIEKTLLGDKFRPLKRKYKQRKVAA